MCADGALELRPNNSRVFSLVVRLVALVMRPAASFDRPGKGVPLSWAGFTSRGTGVHAAARC